MIATGNDLPSDSDPNRAIGSVLVNDTDPNRATSNDLPSDSDPNRAIESDLVNDTDPNGDTTSAGDVPTLVAHIFRRWYARISSTLVRAIGTGQLDMVEDAVQEALLEALQHWPYRGIPAHSEAWLYQVARRKLLDRIARVATAQRAEPIIATAVANDIPTHWKFEHADSSALGDDELTMMFLVAHPS